MKNYILHIGLPKTGTTALQKYYFSKLQNPSICYNPRSIILSLREALKLLDFGSLKEKDMELLYDVIEFHSSKIQQNNILISSELLSQRLMKFDFMKRGHFLKSIFPEATVVLVLRYQPVLLRSLYQQQIFQNYLLQPEEVFIPFAKHLFLKTEQWKANMQIDVKEWNYKETIEHFRCTYGEQFHILFFENYSENIIEMGRRVMEHAGFHIDREKSNYVLPKINISYDSAMMSIFLNISHRKWVLNSYSGFDSPHIQNLMQQANRARYIFNAISIKEFLSRMESRQHIPRTTYSAFDERLLRIIKDMVKLRNHLIKSNRYELPEPIKSYLEYESKILNTSLIEVIDRQQIPKQYL